MRENSLTHTTTTTTKRGEEWFETCDLAQQGISNINC